MVSKFISTMKVSSLCLQLIDDLDEMAHGPSEPLQLGGHQHTAIAKVVDGCLELLVPATRCTYLRLPNTFSQPAASKYRRWVSMGRPNLVGVGRPPLAQSECSAAAGDLWGWVMCSYAELGTVATGARSNSLI